MLDNLTDFVIDHVRPLAGYDCETYEEVIESKCNHWTNLMPTTEEYNSHKLATPATKYELFKQSLRIYLFNKE